MSSDSLQRLRSIPTDQAHILKRYASEQDHINQAALDDVTKAYYLKQKLTEAHNALVEVTERRQTASAAIQQRAAQRSVKATDAGRAKVQDMLRHGWTFREACEQLASEGDREGLASLRAYLPYALKEKKVEDIPNATVILDQYEQPLLSDVERHAAAELRELSISEGFLQDNEDKIGQYLNKQAIGGNLAPVESLWRWQGLPDDGQPKGRFNPLFTERVGESI